VSGVHEGRLWKFEQAIEYRLVLLARVSVLEVGTAGAADQQRIACENAIRHDEAIGVVGVPRGIDGFERQSLDRQFVAVRQTHRDDVGLGLLAHYRDAMRMIAQRTEPGNMVGMQMRVDGFHELEIKFVNKVQIAVDLFEYRIDDQGLAARTAREQVGIGAGHLVEKLTENHLKIVVQVASAAQSGGVGTAAFEAYFG